MSRNYNTDELAHWIVDTARRRLEREAQKPVAERLAGLDHLDELDSVGRQSLGARFGEYLWRRRGAPRDPDAVAALLVRCQAADESLGTQARAFVASALALWEALSSGEPPLVAWCDSLRVSELADSFARGQLSEQTRVTPGFVRGLIEPLLAGDRSTFRNLLGAIGAALVKLDSAALDGRIENLLEAPIYWELQSLLWLLNGVLGASRRSLSTGDGGTTIST